MGWFLAGAMLVAAPTPQTSQQTSQASQQTPSLGQSVSPEAPTPVLQATLPGQANGHWTLDSSNSSISFTCRTLGLNDLAGRFDTFSGSFDIVAVHPDESTVTLTIQSASIDTNNKTRDAILRGPHFLNTAKYPQITFKSTDIDAIGNNSYLVTGNATIHGVTQQVMVPVTLTGPLKGFSGKPRFGMQILTSLDRQDYGITWKMAMDTGDTVLSDNIDLAIDLQAIPATPVAPAPAPSQ
jgi:polyisoprenoid-binding protein YceI